MSEVKDRSLECGTGSAEGELGREARGPQRPWLTFRPLDAGVLVVAEEEALSAVALIAPHHVNATLLAATVALRTLVYVCEDGGGGVGGTVAAAAQTEGRLKNARMCVCARAWASSTPHPLSAKTSPSVL